MEEYLNIDGKSWIGQKHNPLKELSYTVSDGVSQTLAWGNNSNIVPLADENKIKELLEETLWQIWDRYLDMYIQSLYLNYRPALSDEEKYKFNTAMVNASNFARTEDIQNLKFIDREITRKIAFEVLPQLIENSKSETELIAAINKIITAFKMISYLQTSSFQRIGE